MEKNCLTCANIECTYPNGMVACTMYADDHLVRQCKWYRNLTTIDGRANDYANKRCESCDDNKDCFIRRRRCYERDTNIATYKNIAHEQQAITLKELTDQVCDLLITALNEGLLETSDIGKLNTWMRKQLEK